MKRFGVTITMFFLLMIAAGIVYFYFPAKEPALATEEMQTKEQYSFGESIEYINAALAEENIHVYGTKTLESGTVTMTDSESGEEMEAEVSFRYFDFAVAQLGKYYFIQLEDELPSDEWCVLQEDLDRIVKRINEAAQEKMLINPHENIVVSDAESRLEDTKYFSLEEAIDFLEEAIRPKVGGWGVFGLKCSDGDRINFEFYVSELEMVFSVRTRAYVDDEYKVSLSQLESVAEEICKFAQETE